ncbi:AAA family ATPase [Clostridium sp. BJN0001]|uniref:AAA family ATPase n=1 Tax=Clostridium sp. BJN0001 TaxID=2930219 RepID=UPI001FCF882D|nr:AAA family ATPase [Clostridium sp. BJN0001]
MYRELTPNEVIFKKNFQNRVLKNDETYQREDVLYEIEKNLSIKSKGYNIYYIGSFSSDRLKKLKNDLEKFYSKKESPDDICYITYLDELKTIPIFLKNGNGEKLKKETDKIKEKYLDYILKFYESSSEDEEKENILQEIILKRNKYISELTSIAKNKKFDVKNTNNGFVFIPLKDDSQEQMTENEYDMLEEEKQELISNDVIDLKKQAEVILEKLKKAELDSIERLKEIYKIFLNDNLKDIKFSVYDEFKYEKDALNFLNNMFEQIEEEIVKCYSMNLEDDEDKLKKIFTKFTVNVLVDNSEYDHPRVIYEEDPSLLNLIGSIEYKTLSNGTYVSEAGMISAGSILNANDGCIILRMDAILQNSSTYYYLKKMMFDNSVNYNFVKKYMDLFSVSTIKPQKIPVDVKIILIGDYSTYSFLYKNDDDFKRLFPIKVEDTLDVICDKKSESEIEYKIGDIIEKNNLMGIEEDALFEVIKYLSRITDDRNRISNDDYYLLRTLVMANNSSTFDGESKITKREILKTIYNDEKIEDEIYSEYKNKKMMIDINGEKIGCINALSVVGNSYFSIGKPMKVTCIASKGEGKIIDVHKESNMSGSIHEKSIMILKAILSGVLDPYDIIPVNFQLSFEQTYGVVEGDSASVAEMLCILSSLSKHPIKQNIAVTGSLNQFGEVQPIGGLNQKIEGFHKVCSIVDCTKNKGVVFPSLNRDNLILRSEVEEDIENNNFHLFTIDNIEDAIEVFLLKDNETLSDFYKSIENEISKYNKNKKKNRR